MTDSQREKQNRLNRERYAWLKEHGICVDCGHENAAKGKSRCLVCASVKNELSIKSQRKDIEKTRELHKQHARELRQRRKESGLCQWCGRPTVNGKVYCTEHLAKRAASNMDRRRKHGIIARSLMGDGYHCTFCGKDVAKYGDKCCPECLERERKWSSEQRKKIDYENHWWRKDNIIAFHKEVNSEGSSQTGGGTGNR